MDRGVRRQVRISRQEPERNGSGRPRDLAHFAGTLLCGDLFTQPGATAPPVTETEILSASEGMRGMMDYYAHATSTTAILERLAGLSPSMLACQHGSAYRGEGAALLRELAGKIEAGPASFSAGAAS